jgi:hypothetical protein
MLRLDMAEFPRLPPSVAISETVNFLTKATFKQIKLGDSRERVEDILGPSEGECKSNDAIIEKRGCMQFTYTADRLDTIACVMPGKEPPFFLIGDNSQLSSKLSFYDFLDFCDDHSVPWRVSQKWSFDRQLCIQVSQKVVVYFDLHNRELQKIIISAIS